MITPQLVFFIVGIVALVAAVGLLIAAGVYFVRQDIRGVMDDLSGKTRQGGADAGRGARRRRSAPARPAAVAPHNVGVVARESAAAMARPSEDEVDTVLDTKLRKVPQGGQIISDGRDINDDMPTLVTSAEGYHQANMPEMSREDGIPTEVGESTSGFVVTKSLVAIHANEVITAG